MSLLSLFRIAKSTTLCELGLNTKSVELGATPKAKTLLEIIIVTNIKTNENTEHLQDFSFFVLIIVLMQDSPPTRALSMMSCFQRAHHSEQYLGHKFQQCPWSPCHSNQRK